MCGRYVTDQECMEMAELYAMIEEREESMRLKRGEIRPTDVVPLIGGREGRLQAFPGIWGFPSPQGRRPLINARCETVTQRPTFAESFRSMRCAVPTNGYLEWSQGGIKHLFRLKNRRMLYLAGICCQRHDHIYFAILTTAAVEGARGVHDRMPLILPSGALPLWIDDIDFARRYLGAIMPEPAVIPLS